MGALHARCTLRKRLGSDPPPAKIQEWIQKHRQGSEVIERDALRDAFDSGTEVGSRSRCRLAIVGLTAGSMHRNLVSK